jgi:murein L,D-transpeptidase YafK
MKKLVALLFVTLNLSASEDYHRPSPLLLLNDYFAHHTIVAEKSTHMIHLFKNNMGEPELIRSYQMASGKKAGDKMFQGDHRTPEGVYHFEEFLTHQQLLDRHGEQGSIYGVGAFVMNYPNPIDHYEGKTGGGIWLHSTNDETRIDKGLDSRGCLVAHNQNLIKLSQFIELNKTNIVVVHELNYLSKQAWERKRNKIMNTVDSWLESWRTENFEEFISHYSKTEFKDPRKGSYNAFRAYKRAVFSNPGKPQINIDNLTILTASDYVVVTFRQDYQSNTVADVGKKMLYLKQDEYYNWKIVAERWTKNGIEDSDKNLRVAFQPSQRFFESDDPTQIFTKNLTLTQKNEKSNN